MKVLPVILSGGSGTRLWPLSRKSLPKQFLKSFSQSSLFQETIKRVKRLELEELLEPLIICSNEHRFLVRDQLEEIKADYTDIITEPIPKNTAPAIAIAALYSIGKYAEDVKLIILPSDHKIKDDSKFAKVLSRSISYCQENRIITFGLEPDFPHSGYGYIEKGAIKEEADNTLYEVKDFVEKPESAEAIEMVRSGNYLWNSGIFVVNSQTYIDSIADVSETIIDNCKNSLKHAKKDINFLALADDYFKKTTSDSIDYLLLENLDTTVFSLNVIKLDVGWTDLGSWTSVWSESEKDSSGNAVTGDVIALDSKNNLIFSEDSLVATLGINDLVIISSEDALLVAKKQDSEKVKVLLEELRKRNSSQVDNHRLIYRPWGSFKTLEEGKSFKVKRLSINPKQKISLQKHSYRSEHWVVVKGSALVTKDDKDFILNVNESTYIPVGSIHSIENPTDSRLELIEVQSGDYLGEDDIHRFEDIYGREDE